MAPHSSTLAWKTPWVQLCPRRHLAATAVAKSLQSCLCDPIDGSPPGPAVPGILQARTLEWVAVLSFQGPRDQTHISYLSCIGRQVLYH